MSNSYEEVNYYSLNAVLAINSLVIFIELLVALVIQGNRSVKAGSKPKEDQIPGWPVPNPNQTDFENEKRWIRIIDNHLETIPFAILIFLMSCYMANQGVDKDLKLALIILMTLYAFFRILFTFCYAFALQPWRSLSWALSIFCTIAGGLVGIISAFKNLDEYNS